MDWSVYSREVRDLIEHIRTIKIEEFDRFTEYAERLVQLGEREDDPSILGFAYSQMARHSYLENDDKRTCLYAIQAIDYLERSKQWGLLANSYNILGNVAMNQENAPAALDYYLRGMEACENAPDEVDVERMKVTLDGNLGVVYMLHNEFEQAIRFFNQGRKDVCCLPEECRDCTDGYALEVSLLRCYASADMREEAAAAMERIQEKRDKYDEILEVYLLCTEADYYDRLNDSVRLEECICAMQKKLEMSLPLITCFEDIYRYCQVLLKRDRLNELYQTVEIMEKELEKADMIRSKRKLLGLEIEYYKKIGERERLFEKMKRYYELSCEDDVRTEHVSAAMLDVRFSLDESNRKQKKMEQENRQLQKRSCTDALTDIPNRAGFKEEAEAAFERARMSKQYFAMEILDVDYFKEFNDNYGHQRGDFCLSSVAEQLKRLTEHEGVCCARYGGDEFVAIYEGYSPEEVKQLEEELRSNVVGLAIEHQYSNAVPIVTISQGACCDMPGEEERFEDYLRDADDMLYQVKRGSRNAAGVCRRNRTITENDKSIQICG